MQRNSTEMQTNNFCENRLANEHLTLKFVLSISPKVIVGAVEILTFKILSQKPKIRKKGYDIPQHIF